MEGESLGTRLVRDTPIGLALYFRRSRIAFMPMSTQVVQGSLQWEEFHVFLLVLALYGEHSMLPWCVEQGREI